MQDTLQILEAVNQFYSQSFNQLVVITIAILAFAGVVMPVMISLYQKRVFRLEREAIEQSLKKSLQKDMDESIERIRDEYEKKVRQYETRISELDKKIEEESAGASGGIYHVQGNMLCNEGHYLRAFQSLNRAATNHITANKEATLRRSLRLITEKCLPQINKRQLEVDENIIEGFDGLLSKLEEYNINNRYADDIKRLKFEFKRAMSREPKKTHNEHIKFAPVGRRTLLSSQGLRGR